MKVVAAVRARARPHLETLYGEAFAVGVDLLTLAVILATAALGIAVAILAVGALVTVAEGIAGIVVGWSLAIALGVLVPIFAFRAAGLVYERAGL